MQTLNIYFYSIGLKNIEACLMLKSFLSFFSNEKLFSLRNLTALISRKT